MQTISITLPLDVLPPRFQLFQPVLKGNQRGVIVGMHYDCPLDAMAQSLNRYGWEYSISFMFGKSPEQAINAREMDTYVYEDELQPLPAPINTEEIAHVC